MTNDQMNVYLAAVLTTALETEPSPFPESMGYIATGCDMTTWADIVNVLVGARLMTSYGHELRLTELGRKIARKCQAVAGVRA
jgi:hypothetical protein